MENAIDKIAENFHAAMNAIPSGRYLPSMTAFRAVRAGGLTELIRVAQTFGRQNQGARVTNACLLETADIFTNLKDGDAIAELLYAVAKWVATKDQSTRKHYGAKDGRGNRKDRGIIKVFKQQGTQIATRANLSVAWFGHETKHVEWVKGEDDAGKFIILRPYTEDGKPSGE